MKQIDFKSNEKYLSQIPAMQLAVKMGYKILQPTEVLQSERNGNLKNVILENILEAQLKEINNIEDIDGSIHKFSDDNIRQAITKLKAIEFTGLISTNEEIYDLLIMGESFEQVVNGKTISPQLKYIDWDNWENNAFHLVPEFSVERRVVGGTYRPDIVLFVNGIPLCVIENKGAYVECSEGINQHIRNQKDDGIIDLYLYSQLVISTNKNELKYATTNTPPNFWAVWKERNLDEDLLSQLINSSFSESEEADIYNGEFAEAKSYFKNLDNRAITEQDKALYSLIRPERFLDLVKRFILFDNGIKIICRYQQYFAVNKMLNRVAVKQSNGKREGGIIWHTQGSGKSLTMVLFAKSLATYETLKKENPRVVIVTDRVDLDKQIKKTFAHCGLEPIRAKTASHLNGLIDDKKPLVTTLIHKFQNACKNSTPDESSEIFILIDESHRTQHGSFHALMRKKFPNACYLGFTGTPLMKQKKNDIQKFGGFIDKYTIDEALNDGAVVPLLYEGRLVEMEVNNNAIDTWFDRLCQGLNDNQKADLKRKYARSGELQKTEQIIYCTAFDISEHYKKNWQGTGFKAQIVAKDKSTALKFKQYFDEIGTVKTELVISAPNVPEGDGKVSNKYEVKKEEQEFWDDMMKRYGDEAQYNESIIEKYTYAPEPEIIIVVDKLLTGFDAPCNSILYITRQLKDHTLLQAIARVNRNFTNKHTGEVKKFGYILDYQNILENLNKALSDYAALSGYDENDLKGLLTAIEDVSKQLPDLQAKLWRIFDGVDNKQDQEQLEVHLGDENKREDFYEALAEFASTLKVAFSSEKFLIDVKPDTINSYKKDLKQFENLRKAVKIRYAEEIEYKDYEGKIKKLLDTHVGANDVRQLNKPINIFDSKEMDELMNEEGASDVKKADTIASHTLKTIKEKLKEDPAFYEKFSDLIKEAIEDYRQQRLSALEYLEKIEGYKNSVVNRQDADDIPKELKGKPIPVAFYGRIIPIIEKSGDKNNALKVSIETALAFEEIIANSPSLNRFKDKDKLNNIKNKMDDFLYDIVEGEYKIDLKPDDMDKIINSILEIAEFTFSQNDI